MSEGDPCRRPLGGAEERLQEPGRSRPRRSARSVRAAASARPRCRCSRRATRRRSRPRRGRRARPRARPRPRRRRSRSTRRRSRRAALVSQGRGRASPSGHEQHGCDPLHEKTDRETSAPAGVSVDFASARPRPRRAASRGALRAARRRRLGERGKPRLQTGRAEGFEPARGRPGASPQPRCREQHEREQEHDRLSADEEQPPARDLRLRARLGEGDRRRAQREVGRGRLELSARSLDPRPEAVDVPGPDVLGPSGATQP